MTPWPISDLAARMVTVLSASMRTHTFGANEVVCTGEVADPFLVWPCLKTLNPMSRPVPATPPVIAEIIRNCLRLIVRFVAWPWLSCSCAGWSFFCSALSLFRGCSPILVLLNGSMDGMPDALIGSTTTKVPGERSINVRVGGRRVLRQEGGSRHQLSRLAIAALGHFFGDPRTLQGVAAVW